MVSVSTKRELNYVRVSSSSSSWFSAFLGRFVRLMAPFATMSSSHLQLTVIVFHHPDQTILSWVSRQLVYGHFVYDTSSTDISSTDISSTMTFLAEIEAGVMKRILYQ